MEVNSPEIDSREPVNSIYVAAVKSKTEMSLPLDLSSGANYDKN